MAPLAQVKLLHMLLGKPHRQQPLQDLIPKQSLLRLLLPLQRKLLGTLHMQQDRLLSKEEMR